MKGRSTPVTGCGGRRRWAQLLGLSNASMVAAAVSVGWSFAVPTRTGAGERGSAFAYASRAPISSKHKTHRKPVKSTTTFEDPLRSINNFKDNYNFPDKETKQNFKWGPMGCEWTVRMARTDGAYGGVRFRRSLDLAVAHRRNRRLIFQMKPFEAASSLTIGLTEKDPDKPGITLRYPLSDYEAGTNGEWGYYAIELADFNTGHPRDRLNWGRVAGLKIVRIERTKKVLVTTLRNILFEL